MTLLIANPDPGAKSASTGRAALALSVRDLHKQFAPNQVAALWIESGSSTIFSI